MADDKSDDVDVEGEEGGSIVSGSDATGTASGTSVNQAAASSASVQQPVKSVPEVPPATTDDPPAAEPSQAPEPDKSQVSIKQLEASELSIAKTEPEQSHVSIKQLEASELSIAKTEPSRLSINLPEKSLLAIPSRQDVDELPDLEAPADLAGSVFGDEPADIAIEQSVPEPEPARYIEPLGTATEAALLEYDLKPFILDKLYHDGTMGRYGLTQADIKVSDGGSTKYENYKWQLDKMFRKVPEDMSLGKVRLKPDELLYEEEKWVLGKMFRDLREEDYGYMPIAQNQESLVDISNAIEIFPSQYPPEPPPCRPPPPPRTESTMDINSQPTGEQQPCGGSKVVSPTGKVFEFSYGGIMAVSVESTAQVDVPLPGSGGSSVSKTSTLQRPVTPFDAAQGKSTQELLSNPSNTSGYQGASTCESSKKQPSQRFLEENTCSGNDSDASKKNDTAGTCRNKVRCESRIQAVCDAARKAMAIYDTVTGCDNFPCNEGDRPEKEMDNIEDGVWSWLYQLIFKLTPIDTNHNPLVPIPEEPRVDES